MDCHGVGCCYEVVCSLSTQFTVSLSIQVVTMAAINWWTISCQAVILPILGYLSLHE